MIDRAAGMPCYQYHLCSSLKHKSFLQGTLTLQEHLVPYSLHRTHDISMSEISDISKYAAKITLGLNKLIRIQRILTTNAVIYTTRTASTTKKLQYICKILSHNTVDFGKNPIKKLYFSYIMLSLELQIQRKRPLSDI